MNRRKINIHFDLALPPQAVTLGFAAAILLAFAPELGSESVNLSNYYPAPSGVYTQMITTQNTFLATTASSNVGIGTTSPAAKLQIAAGNVVLNGSGAGLAFAPSSPQKGYLYIDNTATGCGNPVAGNANGTLCGVGYYATWTPGLFISGVSYQNRGGNVYVDLGGGITTTQVYALNTGTRIANWGTLTQYKNNTDLPTVYCCPK